jgi:hypothetical protein
MSAFEDFVQTELPKRPYTDADTTLESLLVRRGVGPRQHQELAFTTDGQIPVYSGGSLSAGTVETALDCVDGGNF